MFSNTALIAFEEICQPKPGQIVVITGAAGAVGSHVAQIAKHKGTFIIVLLHKITFILFIMVKFAQKCRCIAGVSHQHFIAKYDYYAQKNKKTTMAQINPQYLYRTSVLLLQKQRTCLPNSRMNITPLWFTGCIVIGFAGSDEKVKYLLNDLKIDAAFNYKTVEIASTLAKIAPQGIDCYFDNVRIKCAYSCPCNIIIFYISRIPNSNEATIHRCSWWGL